MAARLSMEKAMRGAEKGRRELPGSWEGARGSGCGGGAEPEGAAAKLVLAKAAPALLPSAQRVK
jgi:hypothetical protein